MSQSCPSLILIYVVIKILEPPRLGRVTDTEWGGLLLLREIAGFIPFMGRRASLCDAQGETCASNVVPLLNIFWRSSILSSMLPSLQCLLQPLLLSYSWIGLTYLIVWAIASDTR